MNPVRIMLIFGAVMSLMAALLPNVLWLLGWIASLPAGRHLKYTPFGYASLGLAVLVALALAYGFYFGRWNLRVKEVDYRNSELPAAFNGFKLIHISDLHLSTFDDAPAKLQDIVDAINAQNPDLVCFTGDLVTIGRREAAPFTQILTGIRAKYGVASVLGNHDFLIYNGGLLSEERDRAVEELARYEREELGWTLLRDSSMVITAPDGSKITIVGVDNCNSSEQGFKTIRAGNLSKAMIGVNGFSILLTHDPGHWDAEVLPKTDIPLTLSGHTHSAQFSLFGWNPSSWMFKHSYGRYEEDGQTIYVNPGLGCTVPFRIGARPEVTVITLNSLNEAE